jgi:fatty-acyl-CoA synthase
VVEALSRAAEHFPERGVALADRRGRSADRRTYPELLSSLRQAAARLHALGVRPQDRVVLCLPTSWEWLESWFGAVLLGAWPVAAAPPGALGSPVAQIEKVDSVARLVGARLVICSEAFKSEAERLGTAGVKIMLTPGEVQASGPGHEPPPARPDPEATAFLQLTSGSTGLPRAVMIPHRAAVHNMLASGEAIGMPHGAPVWAWAESMISWLPLYHDMGIVGGVLFPMINGLDCRLLSPRTFLARPQLWLENAAAHGVAISVGPNFGYQLCAERCRPDKLQGLDLSPWRAALVGAEMVRPETLEAFTRAFEGLGFSPEAFRPCYGLAEATVAVTFDTQGRGLRARPLPEGGDLGMDLTRVACNGFPVRDTQVRIVAPDGRALPEEQIGEVRVKGPGVFAGYFNDPEATAEGLQEGWLCTGDLGFLDGGELYLTGRTKEILIIRGQNVMPHELEWIAESVTGGGGSLRCGAFSVAAAGEGEQAVLVMEVTDQDPATLRSLEHEIRSRIGRTLSLPLADVAFVRRGKIPKTTSGKVQRRELRERYLRRTLETLEG